MAEVFGDQEETLDTLFGDLTGLDKVNVEEDQCLSEPSRDEIPAAQPSVASWEEVEPTGQVEDRSRHRQVEDLHEWSLARTR